MAKWHCFYVDKSKLIHLLEEDITFTCNGRIKMRSRMGFKDDDNSSDWMNQATFLIFKIKNQSDAIMFKMHFHDAILSREQMIKYTDTEIKFDSSWNYNNVAVTFERGQ